MVVIYNKIYNNGDSYVYVRLELIQIITVKKH